MKKYRLFGKIPVFDIVLIAVLLAIAFVCFNIFSSSNSGSVITSSETKTIEYKVEFTNLSDRISNNPAIGEKVYDNSTNSNVGAVVAVDESNYIMIGYNNETGETVSTEMTDRKNIILVVKTQAVISDMGIDVNGVKLGIGRVLTFNMPSLCASGVITEIKEVK